MMGTLYPLGNVCLWEQQSILLYGSEVWAEALDKEVHRKHPVQVQRRAALRVVSAYGTVLEPAVMVIAGVTPLALLAQERKGTCQGSRLPVNNVNVPLPSGKMSQEQMAYVVHR